jgi:IS1 family transposase
VRLEQRQCPHRQWREPGDRAQERYERARRAAVQRRAGLCEEVAYSLRAHGAAGLLLEPQRALVACAPAPTPGPPPGRHGTAFQHSHLPEAQFTAVAHALAEGVGVSTSARLYGVNKKTVLKVLERAAAHAAAVSRALLHGVMVAECQLDEMWSFVGKKEAHLDALEQLAGVWGDAWIWIAFDAPHRIVLAYVVGKRTAPYAVQLLQEVQRVTAAMPSLFSSDQLEQYADALLHVYGRLVTPPRKPGPGRPPKPRLCPPEELHYVQVVKQYQGNRVAQVRRRVVFGDPQAIEQLLQASACSQTINTAYVERHNGAVRHLDARCNRRTYRFSKCMANHERQLQLCLAYYHLCRTHGTLSKQHGQRTTPFMAAGLTDHVWTMREILEFRPPDLAS